MSRLALLRKTASGEFEFLGLLDGKTRDAEQNVRQQVVEHRARIERAAALHNRALRAKDRANKLWDLRRRAILGRNARRIVLLTTAHAQAANECFAATAELRDMAMNLSAQLADERMKPR